jgi:hypothetical protein
MVSIDMDVEMTAWIRRSGFGYIGTMNCRVIAQKGIVHNQKASPAFFEKKQTGEARKSLFSPRLSEGEKVLEDALVQGGQEFKVVGGLGHLL